MLEKNKNPPYAGFCFFNILSAVPVPNCGTQGLKLKLLAPLDIKSHETSPTIYLYI